MLWKFTYTYLEQTPKLVMGTPNPWDWETSRGEFLNEWKFGEQDATALNTRIHVCPLGYTHAWQHAGKYGHYLSSSTGFQLYIELYLIVYYLELRTDKHNMKQMIDI